MNRRVNRRVPSLVWAVVIFGLFVAIFIPMALKLSGVWELITRWFGF